MIRAIKAVSSERGRDPREYALVAFGGNGPLFAVAMAQALSLSRVLVPPSAGVFSSYGLLYSEVAYHFTKSRKTLLGAVDPAEIDVILHELEAHTLSRLGEDGFSRDKIELERAAALHYQGQSFELEVPIPVRAIDRAALTALEEAYGIEHEKTYSHRAGALRSDLQRAAGIDPDKGPAPRTDFRKVDSRNLQRVAGTRQQARADHDPAADRVLERSAEHAVLDD
jgi:N-methylhydantoinase A